MKAINASKKSEYAIHKFSAQKFPTVRSAKTFISQFLTGNVTNFGYIIPGHGLKGKQQVVKEDEDLQTMYAIHHGKRDIVMFCTGELKPTAMSRKRAHNQDEENTCSTMPKSKTGKLMMEVQEIMEKLRQKHGSKYETEKFSAWAHMIQMGKHESYEVVPERAYFGRKQRATQSSSAEPAITSAPLNNIQRRSECMDQLSKCHSLLDKGVITKEQHDTLLSRILDDIAKM